MHEILDQSKSVKRIMLVIPSLKGGGAERVAVDLAQRWTSDGHGVCVLTMTDPSSDVYALDANIKRVCIGTYAQGGIKGLVKRVFKLRQAFKRYRPTHVVGVMTSASVASILAAQGLDLAVIATEHAHPPSQQLSAAWQWLRRKTYAKACRVVVLTHGTADWLQRHIPCAKQTIIPNAVRWPVPQESPVIQVHKPKPKKWLLAVGRLHQEKGFDVLLSAFSQVAALYPEWDLYILGEGSERQVLQQQIQQLHLEERVFMPGRAGNIQWWYDHADLFVLSSRAEGLSNSLQEAMATGVCCLSFDCDMGPREIIRHDIDGFLIRPTQSVSAMATHLSALMADEAKRIRYATRAVEARDRFSMKEIAHQWYQLFDDIYKERM